MQPSLVPSTIIRHKVDINTDVPPKLCLATSPQLELRSVPFLCTPHPVVITPGDNHSYG